MSCEFTGHGNECKASGYAFYLPCRSCRYYACYKSLDLLRDKVFEESFVHHEISQPFLTYGAVILPRCFLNGYRQGSRIGVSLQCLKYAHARACIGFYIGKADFLPGSRLFACLRQDSGKGCFTRT